MAHGDVPAAQRLQPALREHLAHQSHVPVRGEYAVVIDHDAGALLPPVLQGVKGIVGQRGHVRRFLGVDAEHAALLMEVAVSVVHLSVHHGPAVSS